MRHGEPGRWYERPPNCELKRFKCLESAGLGDEILVRTGPYLVAPSSILRVCVSDFMRAIVPGSFCWCFLGGEGPPDPHCPFSSTGCDTYNMNRLQKEFLTYYIITEGTSHRSGVEFPVFKMEKVGNMEACLDRAFQNASLKGWSTVFMCAVQGDPDLSNVKPGLAGFERVSTVTALLKKKENVEEGKVRICY